MKKARSAPPTANQALEEKTACEASDSPPTYATPLVVDLEASKRGDLEVAMRQGLVLVHYDCHSLEFVPDCHVDGSYGYFGFSPKEELVRLEDGDEVKANLPVSAGAINAKLGGAFQSGTTLDIALMMIGKQRTSRSALKRSDLIEDRPGACAQATHFIRGATLGAFVFKTGTKAELATTAGLFGVPHMGNIGTEGKTSSAKDVHHADGTVESCKAASAKDPEPPGSCAALLRLELTRVDEKDSSAPAQAPELQDPCGQGKVLSGGKCTSAAASTGRHLCKPDNVPDCERQCANGDPGSCSRMGYFHQEGLRGVSKDPALAAQLYEKACSGGWPLGCASLGALYAQGIGVARDPQRAVALLTQACDGGMPAACSFLGMFQWAGNMVPKNRTSAVGFLRRGCFGGSPEGCFLLGEAYRKGEGGVSKAPELARKAYKMGCDGGDAIGCYGLGVALEDGVGGPKDPAAAKGFFQKACQAGLSEGCKEIKGK